MIIESLFHGVVDDFMFPLIEKSKEFLEANHIKSVDCIQNHFSSFIFVVVKIVLNQGRSQKYIVC